MSFLKAPSGGGDSVIMDGGEDREGDCDGSGMEEPKSENAKMRGRPGLGIDWGLLRSGV